MRETYVLADIPKELKDIDKKDRSRAQHKIDFLNKKYGGTDTKTGTGEGEIEDKGRSRYDAGLIVEPILSDSSEVDKSTPIRYGLENHIPLKPREEPIYIPGKGIITRNKF